VGFWPQVKILNRWTRRSSQQEILTAIFRCRNGLQQDRILF
jgi:hypothetical protein